MFTSPSSLLLAGLLAASSLSFTRVRFTLRDTAESTLVSVGTQQADDPGDQVLWDSTTGPTYQDVSQGTTGDCWLDATSAAVAYADPKQLSTTMDDPVNSKGTVPVILWDGSSSGTYTITKSIYLTENSGNSDAGADVTMGHNTWPAAMEDAFREFAKAHPNFGIPADLDGCEPEKALSAIYGPKASITYLAISDTADDALWAVWNKVGSKPTVSASQGSNNTDLADGLPADHAYTAIRCDQSKSIVTLRNPWGMVSQNPTWGNSNGGGKGVIDRGDGVFDISFADWKTYFVDLTAVS